MVKEENQVKRLILKAFQHVIDFLLHISGLTAIDKKFDVVGSIIIGIVTTVGGRVL